MAYKPPVKPQSVCYCGHDGDGPNSSHEDTMIPGHGACKRQCECEKFTWKAFNGYGKKRIAAQKRNE